jgi:hypothetical protein
MCSVVLPSVEVLVFHATEVYSNLCAVLHQKAVEKKRKKLPSKLNPTTHLTEKICDWCDGEKKFGSTHRSSMHSVQVIGAWGHKRPVTYAGACFVII